MARAMAYPMAHPKFCNFTNYKGKNNYLRVQRSSALNSRDSNHFFYETRPQGILGLVFNLALGPDTRRHLGPRVQRPLGER